MDQRNLSGEFVLEQDAHGRLVLIDAHGRRHPGAEPVRDFPVSDPDHFISICDAEGRELAAVADLQALDRRTRDVLEDELARREFVPRIRRIVNVNGEAEPAEWEVETDRGPTRFVLNSADDVRQLGPHRALVIDERGIRYLVEDSQALDRFSRRVIEHYL